MFTREIAIKQATDFVLDCSKYGIHIEKAILFGSVAKNRQKDFSDIDVALVSKDFTKNFIENNRMTSKINIKYPLIEVHHFNTEYFMSGDPFIREITSTGIELEWTGNETIKSY